MFAPLQVFSSYSLLKSSVRIKEYVKRGQELGYTDLVLTDINTMYGAIEFYQECIKRNINPIIGLTLKYQDFEFVLLAKNYQGYKSLLRISSNRMIEDDFTLENYHAELNDLVIIIKPTIGMLYASQQLIATLQNNNAYLGIDPSEELNLYQGIKDKFGSTFKNILLTPINYLNPYDAFATKILEYIGIGTKLTSFRDYTKPGKNYLKTLEEYEIQPESEFYSAYQNACNLLNECSLILEFPPTQLPKYQNGDNLSSEEYLKRLCFEGLNQRISQTSAEYQNYVDRLNAELAVIFNMGFADYFLIVWDVTNYAHNHDILIGPGRGSAAGSLVSYCLYITDVDPIKYDLIFERFLNDQRAQMPDIDLDIPDLKRDQIIKYLHDKYGHNHVSQIITFGTLKMKQVLRDVSRVFGLTDAELKNWNVVLSNIKVDNLKDAFEQSLSLRNLVNDDEKNRIIFEVSSTLEGLPRHYSTHAAGILLSDDDLIDHIPVQLGSDGILLSQFAKNEVEQVGLLKMDFLGLKNLTILENALKIIANNYKESVDISQIDLNDPKTLKLYQEALTNGVFQFESGGIKNVLKNVHPTSFDDVVAVNALYRPGPQKNIPVFITRKNNSQSIIYPAPELEEILKSTYGVMVYQEQVMQVASKMGGFTLGEADLLRRAMSKKNHELITGMKLKFIQGAKKKGYSEQVAEKVYSYIAEFGDYGFNKSHALAYSKMSFELAYIKVHYPAAFYISVLNSNLGNTNKIKEFITEAKHRQISVYGPDINYGRGYFSIWKKGIMFGLSAIKSLRRDFIKIIFEERRKNGKFNSLNDFIVRIPQKYIKQEYLEALIFSGAFDSIAQDRKKAISQLPGLINNMNLIGKNQELLDILQPKTNKSNEIIVTDEECLEKENYYLGMYLSKHPTEKYANLFNQLNLLNVSQVNDFTDKSKVNLMLRIKSIRIIRTKKGTQMAFCVGDDYTDSINLTIFPDVFKKVSSKLSEGNIIILSGQLDFSRGKTVIVNDCKLAQEYIQKTYYIRLQPDVDIPEKKKILQLLKENPGNCPVIMYDMKTGQNKKLSAKYWVNDNAVLQASLNKLLGSQNLIVK
ncbi:DNA polymerase III, alpha subunit [Ligilactobacillus hayakitensis DSM 18933 = JCM 14209]|uniref:DNA polymerase III subunit alpha n=2 Tax=Ligilactobacillus TaxID=2767887 RepID=A0A0R1WM94_9LACO|nr:DNA polymerase III subunit alpha [Ligilactobacillus hayakitensis]KRM18926.1 DNA polymerase III, alpha subunit [Ligilactobacillus hayakitensis DSM 18933 = JCM 14209]